MKAFGTGLSPFAPNWTAVKPDVDRSIYQEPLEGLNTATSDLPSPS
ncbi:MAG: hypothetical protein ABIV21_03980 [Pyrinomonadaceae bacterium]